MKIYVGNTDDRWLGYNLVHKVTDTNFWSVENKESIHLQKVSKEEEIIFVFKTLQKSKIHKRNVHQPPLKPYHLYGVGKVKNIIMKKYTTVKQLWNDYYTQNGCNSEGELKILLKNKDITHMCNIELCKVGDFTPIDISVIWRSKYKNITKGKLFDIDETQPIPSSIDEHSTDEEIGLWIYDKIKPYI